MLSLRQHLMLAGILGIGLCLTLWFWQTRHDQALKADENRFRTVYMHVEASFREKMLDYREILRAARGSVSLSPIPSPHLWRHFVQSLEFADGYPEVTGIFFVSAVAPAEHEFFTKRLRLWHGRPELSIRPTPTPHDASFVVSAAAPDTIVPLLGMDMAGDTTIRSALIRSREEDAALLSDRLSGQIPPPADLMMLLPVWSGIAKEEDPADGSEPPHLIGWVGMGIDLASLAARINGESRRQGVSFALYDGTLEQSQRYFIDPDDTLAGSASSYEHTAILQTMGRNWRLVFHGHADVFPNHLQDMQSLLIMTGGLLVTISLWLAALTMMMARVKGRYMVQELVSKIRKRRNYDRSVLSTTAQGYWRVDVDGRTQDVNPALCRMLGYGRNQLIGRKIQDVIAPHCRPLLEQQLARRPAARQRLYEVEAIRLDGQAAKLQFFATSQYNQHGTVVGSFALISDLGTIETTSPIPQQQERHFHLLVNNLQDGLMVLSQGRIRFANEPLARLIGHQTEDLHGIDPLTIIAPEDRAIVGERHTLRLAGLNVPKQYMVCLLGADGEQRVPVTLHSTVIEEADGTRVTVVTVRDLTASAERTPTDHFSR